MRSNPVSSHRNWILMGLLFCGLIAFTKTQTTSITGKITPAGSVEKVWAIMGSDSSSAMPEASGEFVLPVKAGSWKVVIDAKSPYKDVVKDNVSVQAGKSVNLGEIKLVQ